MSPCFTKPGKGGCSRLRGQLGRFGNIDHRRSLIEQIPPARYLKASYYERWLDSTLRYCETRGLLSARETAAIDHGETKRDPDHRTVEPAGSHPTTGYARPIDSAPVFAVGDAVRARNIHPQGHTRLPRYARSKSGIVIADHGGFVFPDTNALMQGECPARLYTVRFTARELWGADTHAADTVSLDLWEPYLERA